jgi:hypothetical protein
VLLELRILIPHDNRKAPRRLLPTGGLFRTTV